MEKQKIPKWKRDELVLYYDLAKDVGERPYTLVFPYEQDPFIQNAIDVALKSLWSEHQIKLQKEQESKAKQKSWGKKPSGMTHFPIN